MIRIGIDVGGTNTDAAAVVGTEVVARCKKPTTDDVLSGLVAALGEIATVVDTNAVSSVVIGTTHFVNAITEVRHLTPVAAIRLATPPQPLGPFTDWPPALAAACNGGVHVIAGGHQFDGQMLNELDVDEVRRVATRAAADGVFDFVVTSIFSPVNPNAELAARDVILEACPNASVTLSHELGRIGVLERENAALLNGALRPLAARVIDGLAAAVRAAGISAPLMLSQNDGTVMSLDVAREFPILTVASGPTNSMRGAVAESGHLDCVVVDVGGTTSDIGLLQAGFPRQSTRAVALGGVRTNFRMPDVVSIGLGGGSRVRAHGDSVTVGPDSVGFELTSRAMVFGGDDLTLTDIAVAAGRVDIGDRSKVADLDPDFVGAVLDRAAEMISETIEKVKLQAGSVPVVVVGGGAVLIGEDLAGAAQVIVPPDAGAANAIGAALADIGAEIDRIYSLAETTRGAALASARAEAIERAVDAGAMRSTIRVVDEEDIPLNHLPGGTATRIRVRVVGNSKETVRDAAAG